MIRPCQNMTADSTEDDGQTDRVIACVVDMEVAYFPDKSMSKDGRRTSSVIHSSPTDELYRLPCPTVCAGEIVRPRTISLRPATPCPHTESPVEGATASDCVELPGPSVGAHPDVYVKVNGYRDRPPQNATHWLDGKGLSPLMGRPNGSSKHGSTVTVDESLSDLLPEGSRQEKERRHVPHSTYPHSQHVPKPPNYVPLSIGLLFVSPLCGVPCLVFALRAQRAHARGLEKLSRKNNDWAFILLIAGIIFLAILLLIYLVWQMTSALCLPLPSTPTPVASGGMPNHRQHTQQRSKNGIDHLNHSQVTIMPQFRSHDTMFQRPVKLHNTSNSPPNVP